MIENKTTARKLMSKYIVCFSAALFIIALSNVAYAFFNSNLPGFINGGSPLFSLGGNGSGAIAGALCTVVSWFNGPIGSSIASLAVIFLGIAAFFGKANWGTALTLAAGIIAIFSSGEIVSAITGGAGGQCCNGILAINIGPFNACVGGK